MPGAPTIGAALAGYAAALGRNPWIGRCPLSLAAATPLVAGEAWQLADGEGRTLPLARSFDHGWRLLALSGGQPIAVFGEWDGETLLPLGALVDGTYYEC